MGGWNSGRSGWRRKVEGQYSVDIQWMKRKGYLYNGCEGTLTWSSRGKEAGNISYRVASDSITLIYKCREHGGEWQSVEEKISLTHTRCNYGSRRVWMLCPACLRRCGKVYLVGNHPACRKCHKLAYASEGETQLDRLQRQACKALEELGSENYHDYWAPKPKGMHWKTYERHMKVINRYNKFFSGEMVRRFNMMDC